MRKKGSVINHQKKFDERYMQLKRKCTLNRYASYEEHIFWFIKRYGTNQNYIAPFALVLKDRGFLQTTCKIREDIEYEQRKLRKRGFDDIVLMDPAVRMRNIDKMTGAQFEKFLQWFFIQQGYIVNMTKPGHQQGTDLILIGQNTRIAVEAKRSKNTIGNRAVQQINSGKVFYQCDRAWVITNNYFTEQAKELARLCNVELINRNVLNDMISRVGFL